MSTPSIPGVDREALAAEIEEATFVCSELTARRAADAAIAYIAAHQEPRVCACGAKCDRCPDCAADDAYERGRKDAACDLEHADEWVEVDQDTWLDLPDGVRVRQGWVRGLYFVHSRYFVHRDDLPDPDADLVERMARALLAFDLRVLGGRVPNGRWEGWGEGVQERYREAARAALAAYREEGR